MKRTWMAGVLAGCLLTATSLLGCAATHRISRFDATKVVADRDRAAYYALPRTVLQVTFAAKKVELTERACFEALAEAFPGDGKKDTRKEDAKKDVAEKDETKKDETKKVWMVLGLQAEPKAGSTFSLEGTPTISALAEPDPEQIFRADLDSTFLVKRRVELSYGPLGVLQSASSLAQDRTLDYAVSLAKTAGGLSIFRVAPKLKVERPADCSETIDQVISDRAYLLLLPEKLQAGEISKSEAEWLKSELQGRIDKAMSRFFKKEETLASVSCLARPKSVGVGSVAQIFDLLALQENEGFKPLGGGSCLIPGAFLSEADLGESVQFTLSVEAQADQLEEKFAAAKLDKAHDEKEKQGFYYRIPAMARATLRGAALKYDKNGVLVPQGTSGKQVLSSSDVIVAQLGLVAALPAQHAYQTQYTITLDPMTGALQKLTSENETPDPKLIGTLESALDEELKARSDAKKAAAAASDELALLERERKLLEEQKKIRDFKKDLGLDGQ